MLRCSFAFCSELPVSEANANERVVLIFSGGVGLGAYEGGAYAALHEHERLRPAWIAGSSIGGINAAVVAGNAPDVRVERLRELWISGSPWLDAGASQRNEPGPFRHLQNWTSVLHARLLGAAGHFVPRYMAPLSTQKSLYDLTPLALRLQRLVDFDRLNSGEMRFTLAATDVTSGELVVFDTARGERVTIDHLLASCGFLPEFAPVELNGRLLGDGGLSANAPLEAVFLNDDSGGRWVSFVVDLFARDGARPTGLESAFARKNDLLLGNQTWMRVEAFRRESELAQTLYELADALPPERREEITATLARRPRIRALMYLSYRAVPQEAGPEKMFDLSSATVRDRWQSGELDMREAIRELATLPGNARGCEVRAIRRAAP
jgi:NTE family protein